MFQRKNDLKDFEEKTCFFFNKVTLYFIFKRVYVLYTVKIKYL